MTLTTFLTASVITVVVLIIVRLFWTYIFLVTVLLDLALKIIWWAFLTTLAWAGFITKSSDGWGWTFLYFVILYTGIFVVAYGILTDAIQIVGGWIRNFFFRK